MSLDSPKAYYFFCHADLKPVTRYQFCLVLSQACKLVGMNSKTIKSHSFRIGRATDLANRNVSDDWEGYSGLRAEELHSKIQFGLLTGKTPETIFIHVGGNNITSNHSCKIIRTSKENLSIS